MPQCISTYCYALFIVFTLSVSSSAGSSALLDSLSGTAEVQRAGSVKWNPIDRDEKLFNNDIIRIAAGSFGVIRWPDNSMAYAHAGTQILVNIGPDKNNKKLLSYATVFMGKVFFVIHKIIPVKKADEIQVYTPTTVISIRGTSFSLHVTKKTGESLIKMIRGTVRVRCITGKTAVFLSAPFKTAIKKNTSRITTSALLSTDIDSLKQWVPEQVLLLEISRQLSKSRRDRQILSGNKYEKCIMHPFANNSSYKGDWDIGSTIPSLISQRIKSSTNQLEVICAYPKKTTKNGSTADSSDARFIITGVITFFDIVDRAEISVQADDYHERSIGRVSLTLTLKDSHDGSEVFSSVVTGERSGKKNFKNSWKTIGTYPFTFDNVQFSSSLIGSALDQVLDNAAEKLIRKIYE